MEVKGGKKDGVTSFKVPTIKWNIPHIELEVPRIDFKIPTFYFTIFDYEKDNIRSISSSTF